MTAANTSPTAPLYKELPYPADGVVRKAGGRLLQAGARQYCPALLEKRELLIADIGCGTGEVTAGHAAAFPHARVVAVDINPASLALARKLADSARLKITFVQASITGDLLGSIRAAGALPEGRKFDLVCSMGVLHHLADPAVGFAAVRQLVEPNGLFLSYIYTKTGRWDDLAVRDILDRGLPASASFKERGEAIRALRLSGRFTFRDYLATLRWRLKFGPPFYVSEVVRARLKRNLLTHVADHFSNPCEHMYYFGDLVRLCESTGWQMLDLAERYGLPRTPEQHTSDPQALAFLRAMPRDVLFDYFAFYYRAAGFTFFLRPK